MENEELLTRKHLAILLGVSVDTIRNYEKKKGMPVVKIGNLPRYRYSEVLVWMNASDPKNKVFIDTKDFDKLRADMELVESSNYPENPQTGLQYELTEKNVLKI